MNVMSLLVGAAAVAYGLYTAYTRAKNPAAFGKLEAMKNAWGPGPGAAVHVVAYTVVPILFGLLAIFLGITGRSIF